MSIVRHRADWSLIHLVAEDPRPVRGCMESMMHVDCAIALGRAIADWFVCVSPSGTHARSCARGRVEDTPVVLRLLHNFHARGAPGAGAAPGRAGRGGGGALAAATRAREGERRTPRETQSQSLTRAHI